MFLMAKRRRVTRRSFLRQVNTLPLPLQFGGEKKENVISFFLRSHEPSKKKKATEG
jgi:hypothetical protein